MLTQMWPKMLIRMTQMLLVLLSLAVLSAASSSAAFAQDFRLQADATPAPDLNSLSLLIGWTPFRTYSLSALETYDRTSPEGGAGWSYELAYARRISQHFQAGIAARYAQISSDTQSRRTVEGVDAQSGLPIQYAQSSNSTASVHLVSIPLQFTMISPDEGYGTSMLGVGMGYAMAAMVDESYTTQGVQLAHGFTSEINFGYAYRVWSDLELMAQIGARFDLMQLASDDEASRYGMSPGSAMYGAIDFRLGTRWGF